MKRTLILLAAAAFMVGCQTADKNNTPGESTEIKKGPADPAVLTSIEWLDSVNQNLGTAREGQIIEVRYRLRNSGTNNLIIESVTAGCGCTVPEKPEQPIKPGEEQVITAKFDSKGRVGPNHKNITVVANTTPEKVHELQFSIEITK